MYNITINRLGKTYNLKAKKVSFETTVPNLIQKRRCFCLASLASYKNTLTIKYYDDTEVKQIVYECLEEIKEDLSKNIESVIVNWSIK